MGSIGFNQGLFTGNGQGTIRTPLPVQASGAQALKEVWAILLRAFPDLHVTVEDVIASGDKIVARDTVTGTHRGEYMGFAATGKSVPYQETFIFAFVDGRVSETGGVVAVRMYETRPGRTAGPPAA